METGAISEHFDERACCKDQTSRAKPISGVSDVLLELLTDHIANRTVLDIGCGLGGVTREAVSRGATHATGVDLSPQAIREAARLAAQTGLADRLSFVVADAASTNLGPHDVVVLDKVICCYPDVASLLDNSLLATRHSYALVLPCSAGLRGVLAKTGTWMENAGRRIRGQQFRTFVHDVPEIEDRIAQAGLSRIKATNRGPWYAAVYVRP